jgi:RecA-family ATPase
MEKKEFTGKPDGVGNEKQRQKELLAECMRKAYEFEHQEITLPVKAKKQLLNAIEQPFNEGNMTVDLPDIKVNYEGCFVIKPINQWINEAKERPIPRMLFSEFWHEGEICLLFAETAKGKSALAVQIGNSISRGEAILGFKNESEAQTVLYFDFELTDKQIEHRYSDEYVNHFIFDDKLLRVELNSDAEKPVVMSDEEFLISSVKKSIEKTSARVLIIDNLTYLKADTEKARDALLLMKSLKALTKLYNLSLLVLAHTPKRDYFKPITRNDLAGSSQLTNFCDSCFAIGASVSDASIRYIKQIKPRHTELIYGEDNVVVCMLDKNINFLKFVFKEYGEEFKYLKSISDKDKKIIEEDILRYYKTGKSLHEIARELNLSFSKIQRTIHKQLYLK